MTKSSARAIRYLPPGVSLVERLVEAGVISEDQLQAALREKRRHDEPLGQILVRLGLVSDSLLRETPGALLGEGDIDLGAVLPDRDALELVPRNIAERRCLVPIGFDAAAQLLTLGVSDSFSTAAIDDVAALLKGKVDIVTRGANEQDIKTAVRRFYGYESSITGILREIDADTTEILSVDDDTQGHAHPLIRLINAILVDAFKRGASVIHFEPEYGFLRVRYRIDGILRQALALHRSYWPGMAARLNSLTEAETVDADGPTCGHFSRLVGNHRVDFRSSCHATTYGDKHVVRVLCHDKAIVPLEKLGLETVGLKSLQAMLARPDGLIVVAGPPDSGKATTLYSMLSYRRDESICIMTLEETVKYRSALIGQTSIEAVRKSGHPEAVRSLLDQDANIIVIGELCDNNTADTLTRVALSGRQAFTTLEASSAIAAITRLFSTKVNTRCLAGGINGIVAQQLVRKLCPGCRRPYAPEKMERRLLGEHVPKSVRIYRAGACEQCDFVGYKGRVGVFEVLNLGDELRLAVARAATHQEMRRIAREAGFTEIADNAIRLVLSGVTSLAEVSRVVDLTGRLK